MVEAAKRARKAKAQPQPQPGMLGSGPMDASQVSAQLGGQLTGWLELKTAQIEQKVDLKMEGLEKQLLAKFDGVNATLEAKPSHAALLGHTVAIIGIILAVLLTVLAIAGDRFSGGMSASGAFATQAVERERRDAEAAHERQEIRQELKAIRDAQAAQGAQHNVR